MLVLNVYVAVILAVIFVSLPCCCSSQEFVANESKCDGTTNCEEVTRASCISDYHQLELYITGNLTVIELLKIAFFFPGDAPSKFVKLIYNFQLTF